MMWATSDRRKHLPPNWRAVRIAVLRRDRWVCQLQMDGCTGQASEADHIGDRDDHRPANLQAACAPCHSKKTVAESHAYQARRFRDPEPHPGRAGGG